jgi:hypothetical protein
MTKRQFLELSKTGKFADISLRQLLPFNPYQLLRAHVKIDQSVLADSPTCKTPVGPRLIPSGGPPARSGPPSSVILRPWRPGPAPYLKPMAERRSRRPLVSTIHHRSVTDAPKVHGARTKNHLITLCARRSDDTEAD